MKTPTPDPTLAEIPDVRLNAQLSALEQRVERLLRLIDKLASENSELRKQEKQLSRECQELRNRHELASNQLQALIQRLKNQANEG
ncbi:MAG: hypothetical protein ACK4RS_03455 [Thiothrix sp.]